MDSVFYLRMKLHNTTWFTSYYIINLVVPQKFDQARTLHSDVFYNVNVILTYKILKNLLIT